MRRFTRKKPTTYSEIVKSELRRYDRRGATTQKILCSHKKNLHKLLLSSIQICLRNKIPTDSSLTARQDQDQQCLCQLFYKNQAYKFMKTIQCSPAHWENKKIACVLKSDNLKLPQKLIVPKIKINNSYIASEHIPAQQNSTVYIHGKYPQNLQHHSPTVLNCSSEPFVSVCMGMSLSASAPVLFFPAFYFPHVELSDWPPCVFTSSLGAV
ncbi:ATP-dependent DNA helicase [Caerostris darwini]|uniref:ATP-dependent DNA helicase n=1 Tax=Caerostris darwini TaxID=1538125 RepID=A0AAV4W5L2_9ARAC|nr:ATP-dependent DNA helicase [Caerostris darwini]